MKKLLLRAFALIAAVLPLAEAAPKPKAPKIFGDFTPGKTFTFTVTTASSASITGIGPGAVTNDNAPVPKGIPVLTEGQQVTFVVGKKGELIGPGFKVAFVNGALGANTYFNKPKKGAAPAVSTVRKNFTTNEPESVELTFIAVKIAKRVPTTNMVNYILQ